MKYVTVLIKCCFCLGASGLVFYFFCRELDASRYFLAGWYLGGLVCVLSLAVSATKELMES